MESNAKSAIPASRSSCSQLLLLLLLLVVLLLNTHLTTHADTSPGDGKQERKTQFLSLDLSLSPFWGTFFDHAVIDRSVNF
jgi:hypothetical protein